ncbi:HAD family hydrolase [uncultured Campylobacter sp.]|uniref:D-glycero-alpha-D-manno-heptose-1,7-bisphosphate 7-phosphatase n=1 Tax=uncultured Campylobacter sp. TaxID=218934 RepID=UPI002615B6FD|nr:HAD family hydrolase [uncultured Campylobacter sp.]
MKALFLDRDGIINIDKKYVHKIKDFIFVDGIFELCELFLKKGYKIFVITNQSGIARGYYTQKDFEILSSFMLEEFEKKGIKIEKIYYCPHLEACECRKPKPKMLFDARDEFKLNLEQSVFIGDNISDMQAGKNAGLKELYLINEKEQEGNFYTKFKTLKDLISFLLKENK